MRYRRPTYVIVGSTIGLSHMKRLSLSTGDWWRGGMDQSVWNLICVGALCEVNCFKIIRYEKSSVGMVWKYEIEIHIVFGNTHQDQTYPYVA